MLQIGPLGFQSPLILAPLAGYTNLPFRLLCKRHGAGYCVSEMISCHGLYYNQAATFKLAETALEEKPVSLQLFGADPSMMVDAAKRLMDFAPDMIDINMGCPVKKVTKKGAGAALLQTPALAEEIVTRVVKSVDIPVTVKTRLGVNQQSIICNEFGKRMEGAGCAALTLHARTWAQGFSGTIQQGYIKELKAALTIPVIGNGDIGSYQDAIKMMRDTGCDGVMIGRAALGNPWVFDAGGRPSSVAAICTAAIEHLELIEGYLEVDRLLGLIKNQMSKYFKGVRMASEIRQKIFAASCFTGIKELLLAIKEAS